jgi:XTP/dITP diphosphohydrolase
VSSDLKLELLLASGNQHKADEFATLLDSSIFSIGAAPEKIEVREDGADYYKNALLKAEGYYKHFKTPLFSDDSGLTINALPGQLGVHSARFGGEGLTDRERAELVLDKLKQEKTSDRKAYFSAVLCFYLNPREIFYFEGRVDGIIAPQLQGDDGFGYDPIFIPTKGNGDFSFAEKPEWKATHSHRAVAAKAANCFFASH